MSKTDTVAPFSLIFARKVHFSENSSVARIFAKTGRSLSLLKIMTPQQARGVLGRGGALASAKFAHGVHAHGVQPCSEPQCSVAALPSSTSICARGQDQAVALSTKHAWLPQGIVSRFMLFVSCDKSKILHCKKAWSNNDMCFLQ